MTDRKTKEKNIVVKGARLHNLKNIDVKIHRNKLTVVTGLSGSGKSTLAFDTIYAEGQRRFVESLSSYARQFLERMAKPDLDSISGLPPAIAIEQNPPQKNPRSTVGTTTEIYDYLRLLFGRIGTTYCYNCGREVKKDSAASIVEELMKLEERTKLYLMFPISQQVIDLNSEMKKYREQGFFRIVIKENFDLVDIEEGGLPKELGKEDFYILTDRIALRHDEETKSRITESLETAFAGGPGRIAVHNLSSEKTYYFSNKYECAPCEIEYIEPEPRLFSFNNPFGACPSCQGFGRSIGIDENLVIPDKNKSLNFGAVHPFHSLGQSKHYRAMIAEAARLNIPVDVPYNSLSEEHKKFIWEGHGEYVGVYGFFNLLEEKSYKMQNRILISKYRGYTTCKACGGSRLRTSARQVFVNKMNIPKLINMPLEKVLNFIESLELTKMQSEIAGQIVSELKRRLQLLVDIGLEYLTLGRLQHTLSGGEAQRINLSTALGSSLVGSLYVLDEPSIGLHPRDTGRLIKILYKLRDLGNTILVVEHDPDIIKKADRIIDMGPKAGELGGEIVFDGTFEEIMKSEKSITGLYLSGKKEIQIPKKRSQGNGNVITIRNARKHNLKIERAVFPLGCMVVVTGVSGSGKSTLVHDLLYMGYKKQKLGHAVSAGSFDEINGAENIGFIEMVDQSPIGKSSRSTPATYTKAFDAIRELFSSTQEAKQLGLKPGYFSFNVPGGRCEVCEGEGIIKVDMQFLPDVHLECEACKGTRYKREAKNILYNGKSIVHVLNMTINEAALFFRDIPKVVNKLTILQDVGLGYLRLGQPSAMLSGGESQRIKLAGHLETKSTTDTIFIFDEPTTGLHLDDISRLLDCFKKLVEKGNSVVIIEHNIHVIASADHIIDLGPEAGEKGGKIIAEGIPEAIAKVEKSYTGKALREFF